MDPITAPAVFVEAYKAGGIVLVLLLATGVMIYLGWRDARAREKRMADVIDRCQASHVALATNSGTALANNTNAMNTLCQVMRERPCLKEATPPHGAHIPGNRP